MKRVYVDDNYQPIRDCEVLDYADRLLTEDEIYTSNELVPLAVRVLIKRGLLKHTEVEFHYKGEVITVNETGGQDYWPEGYCDLGSQLLHALFGL